MPAGKVRGAVSTGTFPVSLSTKFTEVHTVVARINEYHDGTSQRQSMVYGGRRSWKLSKRLTLSELQTLSDHWEANHNTAFDFWNPSETLPPFTRNPFGSAGHYLVRYASDWEDTVGMVRSDVSVELIEVAADQEIAEAASANPFINAPISIVLTTITAWTADVNGSSTGVISPFGLSFAFGQIPPVSSSTTWAKRTDNIELIGYVNAGLLPLLTTDYGIQKLQVFFFSDNYQYTGADQSSQYAEFKIYDVSLTVRYQDASIKVFRPTSAAMQNNGGTGVIVNPENGIDGDANSYADLQELPVEGLLWDLAIPSPYVVSNFI